MRAQKTIVQNGSSHRHCIIYQSPVKSLIKVRSQECLPSQPVVSRRRLYSEPSKTLIEQGLVPCGTINMDEAWNRFGIRRVRGEMQQKETRNASQPSQSLIPNLHHRIKPPEGERSEMSRIALTPSTASQRHQSVQSASSYGSALSWVSSTTPPLPCASSQYTTRYPDQQQYTLQHQRQENQSIPTLLTRQQTTSTQWKGIKSKQREWRERMEKVELQHQLGRPTDSIDSPYSICLQMRATAKRQIVPLRLPILQSHHLPRQIKIPADKPISAINLMSNHVEPTLMIEQRPTRGSSLDSLTTVSSSSDSESSCTTVSVKSAKSVRFKDDEAHKLWKSLEETLGVDLGCQPVKADRQDKSKQISQIPRLKSGQLVRPKETLKDSTFHLNGASTRPSRLPVASKPIKQNWEPKLKRNSSLLCKALNILRSVDSTIESDVNTLQQKTHPTYIGLLGKSERQRRVIAMERRTWGEKLLQQSLR